MRGSRWSLAVLTAVLGCTANSEPLTSDRPTDEDEDTSGPEVVDAGPQQTGKPPPGMSGKKDAAVAPAKPGDKEPENCGKSAFLTRPVTPDMMILLDRSGSMQPSVDSSLRCDNLGLLDFSRSLSCSLAGIDCTRPADQQLVNCGGTQVRGAVDRWTPSVAAVKTLTSGFDQDVRFGLMTFPPASNKCGPGDLQVPVGPGNASKISTVLDKTRPGGGTPTGETLRAALSAFQQVQPGPDGLPSPQYVLLVTDGQPTCPNSDGGSNDPQRLALDKQHTIAAIDALREEGVRTFVVGYDAQLDPSLSTALSEFAQHGDTEHYYPVQNEDSLVEAFSKISNAVISCDFAFSETVEDPKYLHVTLDGEDLRPDPVDGWTITGNVVSVHGEACAKLQEGGAHDVQIAMDCQPVIYF